MKNLILKFRNHVIELSNNKNFIHHKWYVKYHLNIVEKISLELCEKYPNANKDLITVMVWMHDYGKIVDLRNQYEVTLTLGKNKLIELGFETSFAEKVIHYIEILDKKENLSSSTTPIEIKIVSSADGAAHCVGPFYYMWWYENPNKPFEELMGNNLRKLNKDWSKKIVLPEIIATFRDRYDFISEQSGLIPDKFLK